MRKIFALAVSAILLVSTTASAEPKIDERRETKDERNAECKMQNAECKIQNFSNNL